MLDKLLKNKIENVKDDSVINNLEGSNDLDNYVNEDSDSDSDSEDNDDNDESDLDSELKLEDYIYSSEEEN